MARIRDSIHLSPRYQPKKKGNEIEDRSWMNLLILDPILTLDIMLKWIPISLFPDTPLMFFLFCRRISWWWPTKNIFSSWSLFHLKVGDHDFENDSRRRFNPRRGWESYSICRWVLCSCGFYLNVPHSLVLIGNFFPYLDPYRGQGTTYLHLPDAHQGHQNHEGIENPTGAVVVPIR